jgi:hypothetical protein
MSMSRYAHLAMTKHICPQLSKRFELSSRVCILMTVSEEEGVAAEWIFYEPVTHLTVQEEQHYRQARREMFVHLSTMLGAEIDIFELNPDGRLVLGDVIKNTGHTK